jgi:D-tagatose-1,6-bisphosphate aldolase subunit GatZ/KbaZ
MLTALGAARRLGHPIGIPSVCTAHETALRATLRRGSRTGITVLIEATCNQVNQFGGYTGLMPKDFMSLVRQMAVEEGLPGSRLILGGDHLGPNPWKKLPAEEAMDRASAMVADFVRAGFTKLHLDASMGCAGEPAALDDETIAGRAARLAAVAEETARAEGLPPPLYIIGTEVPVPGGADHVLDTVTPTSTDAARQTIAIHRDVFGKAGLSEAFARAIALVVQPGVEFGHENVVAYDPAAQALSALLDEEPQFVFEAHSTDYQTVEALKGLVRDGFPILKVGPAVTFALREALYGLDAIAGELSTGPAPNLRQAMEALMLEEPANWSAHYHGTEVDLRRQRHFSYSDRIRYYWQHPTAIMAVDKLFAALGDAPLPPTLVSQHLPLFTGTASLAARDLPLLAVDRVLADYAAACLPG